MPCSGCAKRKAKLIAAVRAVKASVATTAARIRPAYVRRPLGKPAPKPEAQE